MDQQKVYGKLPRVTVEELRLDESDLNTKRMLDLMAVSSVQGGGMPLYLHVVTRILRVLRIAQQESGGNFNYKAFKHQLELQDLAPGQMNPLKQRLDTLESFMPKQQVQAATLNTPSKRAGRAGNTWTPKVRPPKGPHHERLADNPSQSGQLTVVDLSCPCITREAACALFNICLRLFLEQDNEVGRVIALDEAHKYMTDSEECATLTETLLETVRLQRHLGARVVISTQEPSISPKLLDLCTITIVHRFTSPDWLRSLKKHLAGASDLAASTEEDGTDQPELEPELLQQILSLRTGEGLLFSPNALVGLAGAKSSGAPGARSENESPDGGSLKTGWSRSSATEEKSTSKSMAEVKPVPLGRRALKFRVRKRITADGGRTIMAG